MGTRGKVISVPCLVILCDVGCEIHDIAVYKKKINVCVNGSPLTLPIHNWGAMLRAGRGSFLEKSQPYSF